MIGAFRNFMFLRRHRAACLRLHRIVEQQRQSFETIDYAKRRAAALKHYRAET
jgi:hypothetical protein